MILERSVVVGLALDGDRTKRCSNGEVHAAVELSCLHFAVALVPSGAKVRAQRRTTTPVVKFWPTSLRWAVRAMRNGTSPGNWR